MRAIGITEFLERQFITYPFDGEWAATFGEPERNFRTLIFGKPGQGKTEFCIMLAKYMAGFTKVYYNSFEQGITKSLQDALKRNNLQEVAGKIIFGDKESFDEMMQRLGNKNSPSMCIIDSRDYMNLTTQQYKQLVERFPRKSFVIVCWESGGKPRGEYAKQIEFMCDVKIRVSGFKAYPRSRFGGNQDFIIWNRKPQAGTQLSLAQQF